MTHCAQRMVRRGPHAFHLRAASSESNRGAALPESSNAQQQQQRYQENGFHGVQPLSFPPPARFRNPAVSIAGEFLSLSLARIVPAWLTTHGAFVLPESSRENRGNTLGFQLVGGLAGSRPFWQPAMCKNLHTAKSFYLLFANISVLVGNWDASHPPPSASIRRTLAVIRRVRMSTAALSSCKANV